MVVEFLYVDLWACVVGWVAVRGGKGQKDGCYRWERRGILDTLYRIWTLKS